MGISKRTIRKICQQTMVYWEKSGSGNAGQSTFRPAVELKVRWEDRQEEVVLLDGRTVLSNAHITSTVPILYGSIVMLGTLANWKSMPTYPRIPTAQQGGKEVFKYNHTPDRKGRDLLHEAYL